MTATAYPLMWPDNFPRRKSRETSRFKSTLPAAIKNVHKSLDVFARDSGKRIESIVLSSNVTLGCERPDDPGVAAWFVWDGMPVCIPVDRYLTVQDNLQAIHHVLEARRTELRHGTLALVRATMTGFVALPSPPKQEWWTTLGVASTAGREDINSAFRKRAILYHPDKGGSAEKMAEINRARDEGLRANA